MIPSEFTTAKWEEFFGVKIEKTDGGFLCTVHIDKKSYISYADDRPSEENSIREERYGGLFYDELEAYIQAVKIIEVYKDNPIL